MWLTLLFMIGAVALDQLSKYLVLTYLAPVGSYPLWEDVFHFTYVENTGMAFGLLKDHPWIFCSVSLIAIGAILLYMLWMRPSSWGERLALASIAAGGIGNMIDRLGRGFVVDFIDVTCIDFYVFNIADSFVCVGCGLMVLFVIRSEIRSRREAKASVPAEKTEESEQDGKNQT